MSIELNTFAEACYNMSSIVDLETALDGDADETDMKEWKITSGQWRSQIELALAELRTEEE